MYKLVTDIRQVTENPKFIALAVKDPERYSAILEDVEKYSLSVDNSEREDLLVTKYPSGISFYINEETGRLLSNAFVIPPEDKTVDIIRPKSDEVAVCFVEFDKPKGVTLRHTFVKRELQDSEIE